MDSCPPEPDSGLNNAAEQTPAPPKSTDSGLNDAAEQTPAAPQSRQARSILPATTQNPTTRVGLLTPSNLQPLLLNRPDWFLALRNRWRSS
jgi:hypothetical protein